MAVIRKILNLLGILSPARRVKVRALANEILAELLKRHERITAEAATLHKRLSSELRYKEALARIDARLLQIEGAPARSAQRDATQGLVQASIRWNARKQACETALNLLRRRINSVRHRWAHIEKEARAQNEKLAKILSGLPVEWAEKIRRAAEGGIRNIAAERRHVSQIMTRSALLHDGRDLSARLARLRRIPAPIV